MRKTITKNSIFSLTVVLLIGIAICFSSCSFSFEHTALSIFCKHNDPAQIVDIEEVAPTCIETGLTSGIKCERCGKMVIPQKIIPTINHIESDWIEDDREPSATTVNCHTECERCGNVLRTIAASMGLQFVQIRYGLSAQDRAFSVTGIGTCKDTTVVIPPVCNEAKVTSIYSSAFRNCTTLRSVKIPDSVILIDNYAFYNCSNLKSIMIPDSVTSIGYGAFYDCRNLTEIAFEGTIEQWNNISLGAFWNYNVPATEVICFDGTVKLN